MPALFSLSIGRWVDRVGPRRIMRLSLLSIIVGLILPACYLSDEIILVCAALSGLGF